MRNVNIGTRAGYSWFMGDTKLDPSITLLDPDIFKAIPLELDIHRPDDLVVLKLRLYNLSFSGEVGARRIAPIDKAKPAYLAAYHQPQSFGEQAFVDTDTTSPSDVPSPLDAGSLPGGIRASGCSRVVHRFPKGVADWDGTQAGLLSALASWSLQHVPLSLPAIGRDRSPFVTLDNFGTSAKVLTDNQDLAAMVARTVRRSVQTMTTLTPATASNAASSVRQTVAAMAANAGMTNKATGAALQAAELQLAGSIGNRFSDSVDLGDIVAAIPGLRVLFKPRVPSAIETAIEIPYRLAMSPLDDAVVFSHAIKPVTLGTGRPRTELWHSRLGSQRGAVRQDATEEPVALAAIWTPDLARNVNDPPFNTSLSKEERIDLVSLTADATIKRADGKRYQLTPVWADRLMLTALGGWLDLEGKWDGENHRADGTPIALVKWSHHAALGRDYAVETVHIGNLVPFGHRSCVLKITERRFEPHPSGGRVASLRQQIRVVVLEPLLAFPRAGQPTGGRDFPFTSVEILTRKTPKLVQIASNNDPNSFWVQIQTGTTPAQVEDFRFAVRATDLSGAVVRFDLPMRFVSVSDLAQMSTAVVDYDGDAQAVADRTTANLGNQVIHLVPGAGPVAFPIRVLRFVATNAPGWTADSTRARVYPSVKTVTLVSTEVGQITGTEGVAEFAFATPWIDHGFGPGNEGEVYLKSTSQALDADLGGGGKSDSTGGFVTPKFGVVGMSRSVGHIGGGGPADAENFAVSGFNPESWFPSAKLFGGVDLKDVLAPIGPLLLGEIPSLKTERSTTEITTSFEHVVEALPDTVLLLKMNKGGPSTFQIKVSVTAYLKVADNTLAINQVGSGPGNYARDAGLQDPDAKAFAKLTFFKFDFFGAIIVSFDSFSFTASVAKGFDPDPKLAGTDPVVFGGPLSFMETLRKSVFGGGASSGTPASGGGGAGSGSGGASFGFKPIIKLEDGGLTVGGKFGVPSVAVGVFSLKNVMASAAIKIPFDGRSVGFVFGFAERANPFQLTVSMFGGGGFVMLGLNAEGVQEIEAALEFGAFAAVDLGIASGGIYVKGGFYFHWKEADHTTVFVGYVEMGGEVRALGIISVSIVLNLSLGFYKQGSTSLVKGQALLTIEVEVLFFSISASVTVERSFAGSESDPRFIDFVPTPDVWNAYAEAFA